MVEKFPRPEGADAAVLKTYGWLTDISNLEIFSRLFEMHEKLTDGEVS